ncbi:MAG TPA: YceI family protein [Paucimonas sp.]|nr:YceI family protein [Paucimonas sp.]
MLIRSVLSKSALAALCLALPALAAPLKVDGAKSAVHIVFKQMNVPVEAKFNKFTAQIDFNNAKPETSRATVDIDIPSFDLGDPEYNKEVLKKEWFNAARYPKAGFVSSAMKSGANGRFDVTGKLTIKGKSADVSFPLSVKKEGASQVFEGALPIRRLAFNIGEGEWKDTDMVADEVVIKFRVVTQ